jgi:hypothetical protein
MIDNSTLADLAAVANDPARTPLERALASLVLTLRPSRRIVSSRARHDVAPIVAALPLAPARGMTAGEILRAPPAGTAALVVAIAGTSPTALGCALRARIGRDAVAAMDSHTRTLRYSRAPSAPVEAPATSSRPAGTLSLARDVAATRDAFDAAPRGSAEERAAASAYAGACAAYESAALAPVGSALGLARAELARADVASPTGSAS